MRRDVGPAQHLVAGARNYYRFSGFRRLGVRKPRESRLTAVVVPPKLPLTTSLDDKRMLIRTYEVTYVMSRRCTS